MSVSSQNTSYDEVCKIARSVAVETAAAAVAIVPTFYGFQVKSAQQTNAVRPPYSPLAALRAGVRASRLVGGMIGGQRVLQNGIEYAVQQQTGSAPSVPMAVASAAVVGVATTPAMIVFTGMTKRMAPRASLAQLSPRQFAAGAAMEMGFLAGMGATNPMIAMAQQKWGKSKPVEYAVAFGSAAAGAAAGHAGDTAMTMWSQGMKIERVAQLAKGGPARMVAVGTFNCVYKGVKDLCS